MTVQEKGRKRQKDRIEPTGVLINDPRVRVPLTVNEAGRLVQRPVVNDKGQRIDINWGH